MKFYLFIFMLIVFSGYQYINYIRPMQAINELNSEEFLNKNALLTIGFNNNYDLQSEIRDKKLVSDVVELKNVTKNDYVTILEGYISFNGLCKHVIVEMEKGKTFSKKHYNVILNIEC